VPVAAKKILAKKIASPAKAIVPAKAAFPVKGITPAGHQVASHSVRSSPQPVTAAGH
jgi:hypothetical protein